MGGPDAVNKGPDQNPVGMTASACPNPTLPGLLFMHKADRKAGLSGAAVSSLPGLHRWAWDGAEGTEHTTGVGGGRQHMAAGRADPGDLATVQRHGFFRPVAAFRAGDG